MASGGVVSSEERPSKQGAREGGARQPAPHFFIPGRHQRAPRRALPQTHAPLDPGSPRPHLVSMGTEEKLRPGLTTVMKIY